MELAFNRKAKHDYEILEELQAGIQLTGHETKSAKLGRMNLAGSYVVFQGGEAHIIGASIASFQPENAPDDYDPERKRKLLLKKKEIQYLFGKKESGLTVVPLRAFLKNNKIKITIALARGRKKHDKREVIKKRDTKRNIERTLKSQS